MVVVSAVSTYAKDNYFVRGIVRDSISAEPLPFASVIVTGSANGAIAGDDGIFELSVPDDAKSLQISYMGYEKLILPIRKNSLNTYVAYMKPTSTMLNEVVVHKGKYSKINNPAVDFLNRLKDRASLTDPLRNDYYGYDKYERITIGLNNFKPEERGSLMKRFPFLDQHIDTSDVSGKPYLGLMVKEKSSYVYYRRNPNAHREIVDGVRSDGVDEIIDPTSMRVLVEDVMREIDLYQNDITLVQNRFVSPLSRIAADFYKFYLTDTVNVGDERCIVLSFYPHNRAAFGFIGHVYVPENDSTMFIRKVEMYIPRDINLNFVDNLFISQTFEKAPDGSRLKTSDELTMEMSVTGSEKGFFLRRKSVYAGHSFDEVADSVFSGGGSEIAIEGASNRDEDYWNEARLTGISKAESTVGDLMQQLHKVPLYYWGEKALKILFSGYVMTGEKSKFDIGPVNSMVSFNSTEDVRLRFGGMTSSELSPRWFGRFYGAYGLKDHRWKYGAELEYSFIDKDYHSREFPVQSMRFTSSYDIERPGQHHLFTSPDNIVMSLKRTTDDLVLYCWLNRLEFNYETRSNFCVGAAVSNIRRESAQTMPFIDGYGNHIDRFTENKFELTLRYAPGEKFFQTRSYRILVNHDALSVTLRQTIAPKNLFGTRYGINATELNIQKRWWFSAFGYLDMYISGGHVWSKSSFLDLHVPNVNNSYIIQPQSFALMNPMEFINSSYTSFDLTYWANGTIFNYIPYLKKLKLREIFGIRGYWGTLDDRNNPTLHRDLLQFPVGAGTTQLNHGPYMEASVGIENIFKVLRVDYVWRLNYLDVPYAIDRHGLRIAVHVTF